MKLELAEDIAGHIAACSQSCDGQHNCNINKEMNVVIFEGLPERGNMICDEDAYPSKKRARDIYLDRNLSISTFGRRKKSVVLSKQTTRLTFEREAQRRLSSRAPVVDLVGEPKE